MENENKNQELPQNTPAEKSKRKSGLRVKINNALVKKEEDAAHNDVIF